MAMTPDEMIKFLRGEFIKINGRLDKIELNVKKVSLTATGAAMTAAINCRINDALVDKDVIEKATKQVDDELAEAWKKEKDIMEKQTLEDIILTSSEAFKKYGGGP